MSVLAAVREFVVPLSLVEQTLEPLKDAGSEGYEAFVLWGGRLDDGGSRLRFESGFFPRQTTSKTADGLLVVVDGQALFNVNKAFYERGLILAGQVHSHPTEAYHSDTDDAHPLMTLVGGLSAVVPDFARAGVDGLNDWAWYRLIGAGEWVEVGDETSITFERNGDRARG